MRVLRERGLVTQVEAGGVGAIGELWDGRWRCDLMVGFIQSAFSTFCRSRFVVFSWDLIWKKGVE